MPWTIGHEDLIRDAQRRPWHQVQPVLTHRCARHLVEYADAVRAELGEPSNAIDFCRERLAWPRDRLDPPPFITGNDLQELGVPTGPIYRTLLQKAREAQLEECIDSHEAALEYVRQLWAGTIRGPFSEE